MRHASAIEQQYGLRDLLEIRFMACVMQAAA
jgi:hypothetical protein